MTAYGQMLVFTHRTNAHTPQMSNKKEKCKSCGTPIGSEDRILVSIGGKIVEEIALCAKHRKSVARMVMGTGKADEVFIPLPRPRSRT